MRTIVSIRARDRQVSKTNNLMGRSICMPFLLGTFIFVVQNVIQTANLIEAHGTLIDPISRNSLWRLDSSAPVNYNDIELFCGGIGVSSIRRGK